MANEVLLEQVPFTTLTRSKTKTECEERCGPVGLTFVLMRMQNDPATCDTA